MERREATECSTVSDTRTVPKEPEVPEPGADSTTTRRPAAAGHTRHSHEILRVGGLAMDAFTGATSWRGKRLTLPVTERELLGVFLRRASQILSGERLAAYLGIRLPGH
jgi:DNA-binding response OmpR family regulator